MNIFLKVPKIKTVLFEGALIVFTIFGCLFMKKFQNKVSANTNYENTSSSSLQGACSCFSIAACYSKSCSESRLWYWKLFWKPPLNILLRWRKSTNWNKGKAEQEFFASCRIYFRVSKCFQWSKQKLYIYSSHEQGRLKILTICAYTENTDL